MTVKTSGLRLSYILIISGLVGCASQPKPETLAKYDKSARSGPIKALAINPAYAKFVRRNGRSMASEPGPTSSGHTVTKIQTIDRSSEDRPVDSNPIPAPTTAPASWDYANDVMMAQIQNTYGSVTFTAKLKFGNVEVSEGTYTWSDLSKMLTEFVLSCDECILPQYRGILPAIQAGTHPLWPTVDYIKLDQLIQSEKLATHPLAKVQAINANYGRSDIALRPAGIFRSLGNMYRDYYAAYYAGYSYNYGTSYGPVGYNNYYTNTYFNLQLTNREDFDMVIDTDPISLNEKR